MQVFLDDERNHPENDWVYVRTVPALMRLIEQSGQEITAISFDNDLQEPLEGWEAVRDIIDRRVDDEVFLPNLQRVIVHSANRDARQNMLGRLHCAIRVGVLNVEVIEAPATSFSYPLSAEDPRIVDVR